MQQAGVPSGRRKPESDVSADIDWNSYQRVHSDRRNLIIHALAVPVFVIGTLSLLVCLVRGDYVPAGLALFAAIAAMALQGRGHALESHAPEPFSGPINFLGRWFREQFLVFPMFILTGRWWHQFKTSGEVADDAA